jgi:N-formylglutamate amidohydrolase
MKDPIVSEIHRYRAAHTKRFNYDIHAIGEDIRRSEAESGGKFVTWDAKRKCMVEVKPLKSARGKLLAAHK